MSEIPKTLDETFALLREIEQAIGALYDRYAARFPALAREWRQLADDECHHAEYLHGLQMELQREHATFDGERFNLPELLDFLAGINASLAEAEAVSLPQAMRRALELENSVIEWRFYEVAAETHPVIARVFQSLSEETLEHRGLLVKMWAAAGLY